MTDNDAPIADSGLTRSNYRWSLLGLGCSVLLFTLDLSIVNIALPTLVKQLNTDFATIQWVVLSYLLVVAALLAAAARAGDLYDKKKLYLGGLALFTVASFLCACANTVELLIAARAIQGFGAVMISALGMAIVTEIAPPAERGKAIGTVGGLISLGVALGPTLGGILISISSWHWIFLVNVPFGVLSFWLLVRYLPALPAAPKAKQGQDFPGMIAMALTLIGLDLGMNAIQRQGLGSSTGHGLILAALVMLVLLVWWEARHPSPIISLDLFRNRGFSVGLVLAVMVFIVLAGSLFLMPFFLETALKYDSFKVGWLMAVAPISAGLIASAAGAWADRVGERPVTVVGLVLISAACFMISQFHEGMSQWLYIGAYLPFGLGVGIFQAPNNSAIMGAAPADRMGTASGLLALSRTLGQSLGIPLMATVFSLIASRGAAGIKEINAMPAESLVSGISGTFQGAGVLMAIAAVIAALSLVGSTSGERPSRSVQPEGVL